jgi:hypothetical protein
MTNGRGKSDSSTVPAKSPNQPEGPAAEATEGRDLAKGNSPERNALWTQGRDSTLSALERVRQAASRDKKQQFTALLHHIYDVARLRAAFLAIKKDAAAAFSRAVGYLWRTVLRRRSQGNHLTWRRVGRYIARWFPPTRVCHPYPLVRLGVVTQGGSRMR